MKKIKKLISLVLVIAILCSFSIVSFANETPNDTVSVQIITVSPNSTEEEIQQEIFKNTRDLDGGLALLSVIRSGNTTKCEVIFNWAGYTINAMRYKQITVQTASGLAPTIYKTFGNGTSYTTLNTFAGGVATRSIGFAQIPTSITTVQLKTKDVQVYAITEPFGWYSVGFLDNTFEIN